MAAGVHGPCLREGESLQTVVQETFVNLVILSSHFVRESFCLKQIYSGEASEIL